MIKLLKKINNLGWYGGKLKINIGIERAFEGFSGRASETWETQYTFDSNEILIDSDKEKVLGFPAISMKSKSYESFEDFIKRVEEHL